MKLNALSVSQCEYCANEKVLAGPIKIYNEHSAVPNARIDVISFKTIREKERGWGERERDAVQPSRNIETITGRREKKKRRIS